MLSLQMSVSAGSNWISSGAGFGGGARVRGSSPAKLGAERSQSRLQAWPLPYYLRPLGGNARSGLGAVGEMRVDLDNFRTRTGVTAKMICTRCGKLGGRRVHALDIVGVCRGCVLEKTGRLEGRCFLCAQFCASLGVETSQGSPWGKFCLLTLSTTSHLLESIHASLAGPSSRV